ncbi:MAG: HAD family phosphatase [Gammaproteobacteria bacterium]
MTRAAPVRNVIFDFGGVLVNWQPEAIISSFYAEVALRDAIRTHAFQHEDWLEMDRGTLDEPTLVRRFAARMQRPETEMAALLDHVRASLTPIDPSVTLLGELRERGFNLYGLSNMSEPMFGHLKSSHPFFDLFHGIVVSAAVRSVKPEAAIYEQLRLQFGLDFGESVFIDDLPRNVESARALGLRAIRFESTAQVRRELEPLLTPASA